jgi:hypothetical protein
MVRVQSTRQPSGDHNAEALAKPVCGRVPPQMVREWRQADARALTHHPPRPALREVSNHQGVIHDQHPDVLARQYPPHHGAGL